MADKEKEIFGDSSDDLSDFEDTENKEISEKLDVGVDEPEEEVYHPGNEKDSDSDIDLNSIPIPKKARTRSQKRKKEPVEESNDEPNDEEDDEVNEKIKEARKEFDDALEKIKKAKSYRRKDDGIDITMDDAIVQLREKMKEAAFKDAELNENKAPALEKLKILPFVLRELNKKDLHESMLEHNILEAVKIWLEPLKDGSLPSLDIRKTLLEVLKKLPIEKHHLKESGLGRVIMFMYKCPRELPELQREALSLINSWSRPIIGHSMDYKDLASAESRLLKNKPRVKLGETTQRNTSRAAIPKAAAYDYSIRPKSNIQVGEKSATNDRYKRLNQQMQKAKKLK